MRSVTNSVFGSLSLANASPDPQGAALAAAAVGHIHLALDCLSELVDRTENDLLMRFLVGMADHLEDARQDAVLMSDLLRRPTAPLQAGR